MNVIKPLAVLALAGALGGCFAVPAIVIGGVGTGMYMANDRRTNDTMLADQRIERTAASRIKTAFGPDVILDTSSHNRNLLLVGRAKNEDVKRRAGEIAAQVDGVRQVWNELELVNVRMPANAANDASLTTQVKARMVGQKDFDPLAVSVTSDGGVVYLQGLVTRAEGEAAARVAATTSGVTRVVSLFEYIEKQPAPLQPAKPAATTQ
jgi:osmotically-inducible protein OsmY